MAGKPKQAKLIRCSPSFGFGIAVFIALSALFSGALFLRTDVEQISSNVVKKPLPVVTQAVVIEQGYTVYEAFTGVTTASRSSSLGFPMTGRITEIRVDVGDYVDTGDVLASLDNRDILAELAEIRAQQREAVAELTLSTNSAARQLKLYNAGHVSKQVVDEHEAKEEVALAKVNSLNAQQDRLEVQMDLLFLSAPYSGIVTHRLMDEGTIATPGAAVFQLTEVDSLEATIGISVEATKGLYLGNTYTLLSADDTIRAKLVAINGVIDVSRQAVEAVFEIESPQILRPGSILRLRIKREIDEAGFWAPISAITSSNRGLWQVYAIVPLEGGWRTERHIVEVLHTDGNRAFVRGTLRNNAQIVIDGLHRIAPHQSVTPIKVAEKSALIELE